MMMNTRVLTISADANAEDAIRLLLEHRISGLPVVDAEGNLVGIISEYALLESLYEPQAKKCRVGDLMTRDVTSVVATTLLSDVANKLRTQRIRRLPVVRDGKVVGIIARRDLLRYVVDENVDLEAFLREIQQYTHA